MKKYIGVCRVIYDKDYDVYELQLKRRDMQDWLVSKIEKCIDDGSGETNLIHLSLITELLRTVSNGFELIN